MKELSIEQKAKAYDDAIEKAKKVLLDCTQEEQNVVEYIYPELKESSDEEIRNALIRFHKSTIDVDGIKGEDVIAWLEKQAEHANFRNNIQVGDKVTRNEAGILVNISQLNRIAKPRRTKPADNVEPKFKVGDWISNDMCDVHIAFIDNGMYYFDEGDGLSIVFVDEHYHLWTIQDAKDGDVLTCYSDIKGQPIEQTGIIKQYVGRHGGCSNSFKVHFWVDWDNNVVIEGYMGSSNIYPSTKEQRDLLLQRMKEEEYEFDFEKKELKKIEQKPAESKQETKPNGGIIYEDFNDGDGSYKVNLAYLSKPQVEFIENLVNSWQNHANNSVEWSEEDIRNIENIDSVLFYDKDLPEDTCMRLRNWLKSLKERIGGLKRK